MFDIGFAELAMVLLIGLLVLGPEKLPRVARTAGLYLRKARTAWGNVKQSVEAELDAEELRKALSQVKEQVGSAGDSLKDSLAGTVDSLNSEIPLPPEPIAEIKAPASPVNETETTKPADKPN